MNFINGNEIKNALQTTYRVYLCGDLKKPQDLQWIQDDKNEIGVSKYDCFAADQPHYHTCATEYNFVICGATKIFLIDDEQEYLFKEGSIFVIPPMTKYASKHLEGTEILFFKSPGGNDKKIVDIGGFLKEWLGSW